MLVLTRKINEVIQIGNDIEIKLIRIEGQRQVRLGISAPKEMPVKRKEVVVK